MNKLLATLFYCVCLVTTSKSQYWQQQVNFTIDVSLNDKEHSLQGFEKIEYINNSPDTLRFIWFHLWPNAYKTDKTAFSDQLLENGVTKFYFSSKDQKGYINRIDFKVNDVTAETEDHPTHIDIVKLILPSPLVPGQKAIVTTPFHVKLPFNFSRGGYDGDSYQVTQWFPKPAVYDRDGWHPMPYLDQGEFYSEFGNYDVRITVPENYVVAATGQLQNAEEKSWLLQRDNYSWKPIKKKIKKGSTVKTVVQNFPPSSTAIKTLRYTQQRVHDFAWFADKRFIVKHDTCMLASGRSIEVYSYYTAPQAAIWKTSVRFAKDAVRHYSRLVGEYPYDVVSVVQGPASFGGGMEYPTITVIAPEKTEKDLDLTIAHEIGHNWFYGILASNERRYPWMDEGINSYYEDRYRMMKYHDANAGDREHFLARALDKSDQPITTPSEVFSESNYNLVAYYKTAEWMRYLESELGETSFNKAMQAYFEEWKFRHPQPSDFKNVLTQNTGRNLDSFFKLQSTTGLLPNQALKGTRFDTYLQPQRFPKAKNVIMVGPSIGLNNYDKLMIGGLITNYRMQPSPFEFLLAPLYATGSKKLAGMGFARYTFYPSGIFKMIRVGLSGSTFSINDFKDESGEKTTLSMSKLVPSIRLTLRNPNPRSTLSRYIQFKSFFISEDVFQFYRDTAVSGTDTSITSKARALNGNRTLTQLKIVMANERALYPYSGELKFEQGKNFVRTAFTGNYFFNYAKGGGLDVRLFAGKFFYTSGRTFTKQYETDRYHLNMTGPNGYEDYTYSDYFAGRNEFDGLLSQQIMVRDGAFKVRTDLLADKVGKTDNWLVAANFSSSIPSNINPLSVLPFKFPIKVFADIGTYADAWKKNADLDRFLFDAGLHIPILKATINIYIPLLYSKVYKDYIRSTIEKKNRFFKTISFSIDISNFSLRKFNRNFTD